MLGHKFSKLFPVQDGSLPCGQRHAHRDPLWLSKRGLLIGLSCCAFSAAIPVLSASPRKRLFCTDSRDWVAQTEYELDVYAKRSRDAAAIVARLRAEDQLLSNFFGLSGPLYIGENLLNAGYNGEDNSIVIGEQYLPLRPSENYERTLAVFAHETSHRFQVQNNIHDQLGDASGYYVKYIELHADYMAGAYMASRSGDLEHLRDIFFYLGDLNPVDEDHHGFGAERFSAFDRGYKDFLANLGQNSRDAFEIAFMGVNYVRCTVDNFSNAPKDCSRHY